MNSIAFIFLFFIIRKSLERLEMVARSPICVQKCFLAGFLVTISFLWTVQLSSYCVLQKEMCKTDWNASVLRKLLHSTHTPLIFFLFSELTYLFLFLFNPYSYPSYLKLHPILNLRMATLPFVVCSSTVVDRGILLVG